MKSETRLLCSTIIAPLLFLFGGATASAQYADGLDTDQPLFATHDILKVRIEAPLSTLVEDRPEEKYLDGMFFYIDAKGQEQKLDLKIRTRGRFRLKKETCNFPPIRLNFKKGQVEETEFARQDKLKLVSHCQTKQKYFEQLVLREYLAYRIYQTLTDKSFGTRLMRISYVDTEGKIKPLEKYGFVIEDNGNIGERLGLTRVMINGIKHNELDRRQASLLTVFMYLIGSTDFSLVKAPPGEKCCHNAVVYSAGSPPYTPIPYDFDISGIVDVPYAEPNPRFLLHGLKNRLYRGRCTNNGLLDETFAYFLEKESEIRTLIDGLEGLDNKNRKEVIRFIDEFFEDIQNPKSIQKNFIRRCN